MAIEQIVPKQELESTPSPDTGKGSDVVEKKIKPEQPALNPDQPITPSSTHQATVEPVAPVTPAWQVARAQEIDKILSEGLNEVFLKMNPADQVAFKLKGEETVMNINILLSQTKVQLKKILDLIRDWLRMIPGINNFFLEQEVKIKADKIIELKNKF